MSPRYMATYLGAEGGVGLEDGSSGKPLHVRSARVGHEWRGDGDSREDCSSVVRLRRYVRYEELGVLWRQRCYRVHDAGWLSKALSLASSLGTTWLLTLQRRRF